MHYLIAIVFSLFPIIISAQDYYQQAYKFMVEGDTIPLKEVIQQWEKVDPTNPDLFTTKYNYLILTSRKEVMQMVTEEPYGEYLEITDSTGKVAGYMTSTMTYDIDVLKKAFSTIDSAIALYPDRLDMRFGKIHMLGEVEQWEPYTLEILSTIERIKVNQEKWLWTEDSEEFQGSEFLLNAIQDYQVRLYDTGEDSLLILMQKIAKWVLKTYPENIPSLSNLSITYLLTGEYAKALTPLFKAEALDPNDPIILSNIAQAYVLLENKEKAIEYYNKTIQVSDNQGTISYCKKKIEELKAE